MYLHTKQWDLQVWVTKKVLKDLDVIPWTKRQVYFCDKSNVKFVVWINYTHVAISKTLLKISMCILMELIYILLWNLFCSQHHAMKILHVREVDK